ncbi:DUF4743 domain-containing protein [Neisseriaceae bacterium PsAf]|nr:DUF4743 domain-containing protein [Neisseriaceae bacterium PsAf]
MYDNYINKEQQNEILAFLQPQLNPVLSEYQNLYLNGCQLGLLSPKFKKLILEDLSCYAQEKNNSVYIQTQDWYSMAKILTSTTWNWHEQKIYDGWRNELFDVFDAQDNNILFQLERSAFRPLGLKSHAVHLNAWFLNSDNTIMHWIAKRSSHKEVSPNQLDNIACGGISAGESPHTSIVRESFEEAGIHASQLKSILQSKTYFSFREVHRGVHREYLHVYHLQTTNDLNPHNLDGEVNYFQKMNHQEIIQAILNGEFMLDSIISLLDLWLSLKCFKPDGHLGQWMHKLRIVR